MSRECSRLSAFALALALVAGCAAPPARRVETHLGANARIFVEGREVRRDGDGVIEIPLGPEREVIRVVEPNKPPVLEAVAILVDPPGDVEDRLVYSTFANTTVVHTGERGGSIAGGPGKPVVLVEDPLSRLVDRDGPFFGPAEGAGVVLVTSDATAHATVDGRPVPLEATHSRFRAGLVEIAGAQVPVPVLGTRPAAHSYPAVVRLEPGAHALRVEKTGMQPYVTAVEVPERSYVLVCVRLAEEREGAAGAAAAAAAPGAGAGTSASAAAAQAVTASARPEGPR